MDYRNELTQIGIHMKAEYANCKKNILHSPTGTLQIIDRKTRLQINQVTKDNDHNTYKGICANENLIKALAKKLYIQEYCKRLNGNMDILRTAIKSMQSLDEKEILKDLPANFEKLPQEFRGSWLSSDMHPIFTNDIPIENWVSYIPESDRDPWASKPYRANTSHMDNLKHRTLEGISMRSKDEMNLFAIYKEHGFATHYDELIRFGSVVKSPDFVSMRKDGKLIIHEHCGRTNDPQYMNAHKEKLQLYEEYGIVPWDNLIITYDSANGTLDLKLAEAQICAMLEI